VAVARRKAIEKQEQIQKMISKRGQAGLIVHTNDGRLFFLSSKDVRRTKISPRDSRSLEKMLSKQGGGRRSAEDSSGCTKTLRWLLSHNPKSVNWRKVSVWWMKNC
jgi:hypothetical protein